MRKLFLSFAITIWLTSSVEAQNRQWDKPMQLKTCNITIKANYFTATTFMELEFYNPNPQEIEGLQLFQLMPGQAVTAFQLMLNGQYRDGSIEEKWKATNVYNTIVGKRVDPAILKLEYGNNYSLHIYPVPAKGTRSVTITIQEVLPLVNNELRYSLPFKITDICENFSLNILAKRQGFETIKTAGLIAGHFFSGGTETQQLQWATQHLLIKQPVEFSIPLRAVTHTACADDGAQKYFALRHHSFCPVSYPVSPSDLTVFWDISNSAGKRNIKKEISFLQQLIGYHHISRLTIIPFNYSIKDTATFYLTKPSEKNWKKYLNDLQYGGATQLGCIDISQTQSDMFLLFSDGINTYRKRKPTIGKGLLYCVNSSEHFNFQGLQETIGSNGGKVINLANNSIAEAITATSTADNWLLNITSANGKTIVEQDIPVQLSGFMLFNGTTGRLNDTVYLHFGNSNQIRQVDTIVLNNDICTSEGIERVNMLNSFAGISNHYNWENILEFGLKEKVVTYNTAFIVLEKASDYVKYNIAPPKDLEDECRQMNFVIKDTRWQRRQKHKADDYERLNTIVNNYNTINKKLDPNTSMITLNREEFYKDKLTISERNQSDPQLPATSIQGKALGLDMRSNALQEVVVVGYGTSMKRSLTGSVAYINGDRLGTYRTVEQALEGRVAGVQITNATGAFGSSPRVSIRGASSFSSNNQPLYVLDGIAVDGNINQIVNPNDINDISVLKDASATAIFGSRGANGVIVINTKKGTKYYYNYHHYNRKYKLSDAEDEDYLTEWKEAAVNEKLMAYNALAEQYTEVPGFYFDMADAFFKLGKKEAAMDILMNAPEAANGSMQVDIAMAYILESWGNFKEATAIYEQLLSENPQQLTLRRNLAWAYYQQGLYQQAATTLFAAIQLNMAGQEYAYINLKTIMLKELNAIVNMHKAQLDTGFLPAGLIQPVKADLRIIVDCNQSYFGDIKVREPGGYTAMRFQPVTKNGGMITCDNYYYNCTPVEYQVNAARNGKYTINTNYYGNYYAGIPCYVRIISFKNFGKEDQQISIENAVLDNQSGEIEIGELNWPIDLK
ncbi:MAG: TonB-dependent receptor plug domain-containing protein [Chitinophagaceae bacterium]|nr:TonB-dependent receptor plug domain-containing protein [Chitinophagaceae bacterium]